MVSILIDYNNIIKPNKLILLEKHIKPVPKTKYNIGLILHITAKEYKNLEDIPKGKRKLLYLDTQHFINGILNYSYVVYDKKRKICEIILEEDILLPGIVDITMKNLPNDVILWSSISLQDSNFLDKSKKYMMESFSEPYICNKSPLGFIFNSNRICLSRQNNIIEKISAKDITNTLKQFKTNFNLTCSLKCSLTNKTLKYLRQLCNIGSTVNKDGRITQKELAGSLLVSKRDSDLTHYLEVDEKSLVTGSEEGVEVTGSLYNFHSHPAEAYNKYNVKLGWPSAQDYIGFLASNINHDTILHIVVGIEGYYIISLSEYWVNKKDMIDNSIVGFISDNYDYKYKKNQSVKWYIQQVNNIKYKNLFPLFIVQFFEWHKKSTFIVPFSKKGSNCFVQQRIYDKYLQLHRK